MPCRTNRAVMNSFIAASDAASSCNDKDVPYLLLPQFLFFCLGPSSPKQRPGQEQGIASAIDNGTGTSTLSRFHGRDTEKRRAKASSGTVPFRRRGGGVSTRCGRRISIGLWQGSGGSTTVEERVRVPLYATDAFLAGGLPRQNLLLPLADHRHAPAFHLEKSQKSPPLYLPPS